MTTHALVPCVLVRRDLRLEHELAVLDGSDAVTNLVPPIHPIPSAAPTAPGSASATTMRPTTPPIHPIPSAAPTAPWLGLDDNYPDDNYPDDNYPDDNYSRSALTDHNVACHLVHDNHDPNPGRSIDGIWPDNPGNRSATHQGGSHDETQEDQEPHSTNRGRWGDVDVVNGRI